MRPSIEVMPACSRSTVGRSVEDAGALHLRLLQRRRKFRAGQALANAAPRRPLHPHHRALPLLAAPLTRLPPVGRLRAHRRLGGAGLSADGRWAGAGPVLGPSVGSGPGLRRSGTDRRWAGAGPGGRFDGDILRVSIPSRSGHPARWGQESGPRRRTSRPHGNAPGRVECPDGAGRA